MKKVNLLKYYTFIYTISSDGRNIFSDKCVVANNVITFVLEYYSGTRVQNNYWSYDKDITIVLLWL